MFNSNQKAAIIGLGFAAATLLIPDGNGFSTGNIRTLANLYYADSIIVGGIIDLKDNLVVTSSTLDYDILSTTLVTSCEGTTQEITASSNTLTIMLSSLTQEITFVSTTKAYDAIRRTEDFTITSNTEATEITITSNTPVIET